MSWQVITLGSDFNTTENTTPQATGLKFTPTASTRYWVKAVLRLKTTDVLTGAFQIGWAWPTGLDYSIGSLQQPTSVSSAEAASREWGPATTEVIGVVQIPEYLSVDDRPWVGVGEAILHAGSGVSGDLEVMLKQEPGGSATVTLIAGSQLWVWDY